MKLKSWSTDMCTNKIKYYSEVNEGYYCSHWTLYLLNENEFEKNWRFKICKSGIRDMKQFAGQSS